MRPSIFQLVAVVGIVATLFFVPLGALLTLLCVLFFDLRLQSIVTFGGRFSAPAGLVAWWMLAWLPAAVYVAITTRSSPDSRASGQNKVAS